MSVLRENYIEWELTNFEEFVNNIHIEEESISIPSCFHNWKFKLYSDMDYIVFSVIDDGPIKNLKCNGTNEKFSTKFVLSLQSRTNQFPEFMGKEITRNEDLNDLLYQVDQLISEYETFPPSYIFQISYFDENVIYIKKNEIRNFIEPLHDKNNLTIGIYIRLYKNNEEIEERDPIPPSPSPPPPPQKQILVLAIKDFIASEPDQLTVKNDDLLIVTDENPKEGWVLGYKNDNESEKGLFPKDFILVYNGNEIYFDGAEEQEFTKEYKTYYEDKEKELRKNLEENRINDILCIDVDRNNIFTNAYDYIITSTNKDLKKVLDIQFLNEDGIDCGEIGNPGYSLFKYIKENSYRMNINPESGIANENHLDYFEFIGIILGIAIFNSQHLDVSFTLPFYKRLLNKNLILSDLKYIDPDIYKSLNWLKENNGVEDLFLTFEIENEDSFGNKEKIELKPNGSEIPVTDENKEEYIKLNTTKDKDQMEAIKRGFYKVIPNDSLKRFNEFDLELLIYGSNEIDVDDWKNNTDYSGYNENDITIINFWKCVREFDNESRKRLVLFATGNSQIPSLGFKYLQGDGKITHFKLKKAGDLNKLPVSHTCFNCIDLPPYENYDQLKDKLLYAIQEGINNFSIA
ncbi:hypothetical protein U3516DRAFT_656021 [Neocallimastix sp. 'constans']